MFDNEVLWISCLAHIGLCQLGPPSWIKSFKLWLNLINGQRVSYKKNFFRVSQKNAEIARCVKRISPLRDKCPSFPILKDTLKKQKSKRKNLLLIKLSGINVGWSWWEKKRFEKVLDPHFQYLSIVNCPRNKGFLFLFIELSQMHFSRTPG